jgi:hypothetical protein
VFNGIRLRDLGFGNADLGFMKGLNSILDQDKSESQTQNKIAFTEGENR